MKNVSNPNFWNQRYKDNNTRWDIGQPTPIVTDYLKKNKHIGKVCILGCGTGYDAIEFALNGNDVYAVDFSIEALNRLRTIKPNNLKLKLVHQDIFDLASKYKNYFDLVFEYTCFCAIDPKRRLKYFNLIHTILKKNALLFGIFLPFDKDVNNDGPPFGIQMSEIKNLSKKKFKLINDAYSELSIDSRKGREKIIIMEKI